MGRSQPDWLPGNVTLLPVNILQLVLIAACTVGCAVDNTRDNSAIKQEAFYETITIVHDGVRVELFVQGLNDGPIQMRSWPLLQQRLSTCTDCQQVIFLPIQGAGHDALFSTAQGQAALNTFINNRR